jgi:hypothetical protein
VAGPAPITDGRPIEDRYRSDSYRTCSLNSAGKPADAGPDRVPFRLVCLGEKRQEVGSADGVEERSAPPEPPPDGNGNGTWRQPPGLPSGAAGIRAWLLAFACPPPGIEFDGLDVGLDLSLRTPFRILELTG